MGIEEHTHTIYYLKCDNYDKGTCDNIHEEYHDIESQMIEDATAEGWTHDDETDEWFCPECSKG